jgi:hypothetical protein
MSPESSLDPVDVTSPEDGDDEGGDQSSANPSARPWATTENTGEFVRVRSIEYPGTSRDSNKGRTSQMWTLPVSAQVATWYGSVTGGRPVFIGRGWARTRFTPPTWGIERNSNIASSSTEASSSSSSSSEKSTGAMSDVNWSVWIHQ